MHIYICILKEVFSWKLKGDQTMSSYGERADVMKNMWDLHLFYLNVLSEYIKRLDGLSKRSSRIHMREDEIRQLDQAIKFYYNKQIDLFQNSFNRKETPALSFSKAMIRGSEINPDQLIFQDQAHIPNSQELTQTHRYNKINLTIEQRRVQRLRHDAESRQVSTLATSNVNGDGNSQISKMTGSKGKSESSDESQSDPNENFAERAEQFINTVFFGTFSPPNIKRKPKEQKIFMEVQNVFVKFREKGRDSFFERANFQLTKLQKAQAIIPQQKIQN